MDHQRADYGLSAVPSMVLRLLFARGSHGPGGKFTGVGGDTVGHVGEVGVGGVGVGEVGVNGVGVG